ncbi:ribosomal RNA small subunit methyltransferase A [Candidatus Dependentiae bacterium]|nr:ribosomal RNA small subunit methyltransferase A [Candidatus Dependentiae bacterium]
MLMKKKITDKHNNHIKKLPQKKKKFGQHFLRKQSVVDHMIEKVKINSKIRIIEIGCGDGFLTQAILNQTNCKELISYEIDPQWAEFVKNKITDPRLTIKQKNILEIDFKKLESKKPWVILSNLPYQITFPIFFLIQKHKTIFNEGVVMIQEEVAQKIVATKGKSYNTTSLFLQYHFELELMEKIEPQAFVPKPKVFSRLLYFKPKLKTILIKKEEEFWKFVKLCFSSPRRTIKNNLKQTHYNLEKIPEPILKKRAQQLRFKDFFNLWNKIIYDE